MTFSHAPAYEIRLRSRKILNEKPRSSVVITEENKEEQYKQWCLERYGVYYDKEGKKAEVGSSVIASAISLK